MIKVKNPNQLNIFDPWDFLSPKRRQLLDQSWAGLFREHILPTLPVERVFKFFDESFGRPSKELYSRLGTQILQQTFDLTDEETLQQYAFNIQWHYCLNITEESDSAKYISGKTLWNDRKTISQNDLEDVIFTAATTHLADVFKVNSDEQRIDSVHIKSNMRRLGRIGIFSESIHKFLVNLNRQHPGHFQTVEKDIIDRYFTKKDLDCFSRVKPSESRKTLNQVSKDLFHLVEQFKGNSEVPEMYSYKMLQRVLNEQCNLTKDEDHPVEVKKPKEIPSNSLQNPSDPDASYSRHKGQGYQVQIMETFCKDEEEKDNTLNLITHVDVEPAHKSDANALIPAIESADARALKPDKLSADSLYGSDENAEKAIENDVELIAPTMGTVKEDKISLQEFCFSEGGQILCCPQGHAPKKIKKKKRVSIAFSPEHCDNCPMQAGCPVKKGKKLYYLRFSDKELRIAKRRAREQSDEFIEDYRWRAGVEATMSEYDRRTGVKNLRVRGLKAVKFCATLKALGINILRAAAVRVNPMQKEYLCAA